MAVLDNKECKSWKFARVSVTSSTIISLIATFTKARSAYLRGAVMYYAKDGDIVKTFDNFAASVTNSMRSSYTSTNITGTATYTVVYIEVVWPWLVYSIVLTVLVVVLLGMTMWLSSRKGSMVWKSSSFAPLFHGIPDDRADGRFVRKGTMEKVAKLMYGKLEEDEKGAVKLKLA